MCDCCKDVKGCERPEELEGKPQDCSPEQIRTCHGEDAGHPCIEDTCENPDELSGKPQDCSPEQVRRCHGDDASHPCTGDGS